MTDEGEIAGGPPYGVSVAAGLLGIVFLDTIALVAPWVLAAILGSVGSQDAVAIALAGAFVWTGVFGFVQFGWAVPIAALAYWRGNQGLAVGVLVGAALVSLLLVGCFTSLAVGIGAICGGLTL